MAANITDLLDRVSDSNTVRPIIATLASPGKAIGATSLNVDAATGWTSETALHFSVYETTTIGNSTVKNPTTQTDWKGTLSGVTVSNLTLTGGTDRAYTAGAVVEITPTARYAKDLYDWAIVGHNQNGSHKAFTETAIVPTAALQDSAVTKAKVDWGTSGGIWWEEVGRTATPVAGTGGTNVLTVTLSKPCKYIQVVATGTTSIADSYSWVRFNGITSSTYERSWSQTNAAGTFSSTSNAGTVGTMGNTDWGFNVNFTASVGGNNARWSGSLGSYRRASTFGGQLPSVGTGITSLSIGFDNSNVTSAELIVLGHN